MIRNLIWLVSGIFIGAIGIVFWHVYYYMPQLENNAAYMHGLCESQIKTVAEQIAQLDFEQNNILVFKDAFTPLNERKSGKNSRAYITTCMKSPMLNTEGCFIKAYKDKLFTLNPDLESEASSKKVEQGAAANP
jgi:hypothetical protein